MTTIPDAVLAPYLTRLGEEERPHFRYYVNAHAAEYERDWGAQGATALIIDATIYADLMAHTPVACRDIYGRRAEPVIDDLVVERRVTWTWLLVHWFMALVHPATTDCVDPECSWCAERDCPFSEPLHYHHDGCPMCDL